MHFELFYIRWEKKRKNEQGSAGFQKLFLGVHQGHLRVANGNRLTVKNTTVSIKKSRQQKKKRIQGLRYNKRKQ